jgi:hypothetical protein
LVKKEQAICFVLEREMQGDLFIPKSWTKMTTWVEEIQLVTMKIMRGKPNQVWCTIERIKHHHENHKHESFYLTPSLFLDFTCNFKHELKLDLWKFENFHKEKLHARKKKWHILNLYEIM